MRRKETAYQGRVHWFPRSRARKTRFRGVSLLHRGYIRRVLENTINSNKARSLSSGALGPWRTWILYLCYFHINCGCSSPSCDDYPTKTVGPFFAAVESICAIGPVLISWRWCERAERL